MDECCAVTTISGQQRRVFRMVLWINVCMFILEAIAGIVADSTALLADSVDMLGDAIVYGFSLYVVGRGSVWQVRAALLKGIIMAAFGVGVLAQVAFKIVHGLVPTAEVMASSASWRWSLISSVSCSSGNAVATTSICSPRRFALETT